MCRGVGGEIEMLRGAHDLARTRMEDVLEAARRMGMSGIHLCGMEMAWAHNEIYLGAFDRAEPVLRRLCATADPDPGQCPPGTLVALALCSVAGVGEADVDAILDRADAQTDARSTLDPASARMCRFAERFLTEVGRSTAARRCDRLARIHRDRLGWTGF